MTLVSDQLTVFVPTRLVNPLNERVHWSVRSKRAKAQRDAVAMAVWAALRDPTKSIHVEHIRVGLLQWRISAKPTTPKRITLVGHVARKFDSHDNLRAALKSVVDGLVDAHLIGDDRDSEGHTFLYDQIVAKPYGVTITICLPPPPEACGR